MTPENTNMAHPPASVTIEADEEVIKRAERRAARFGETVAEQLLNECDIEFEIEPIS